VAQQDVPRLCGQEPGGDQPGTRPRPIPRVDVLPEGHHLQVLHQTGPAPTNPRRVPETASVPPRRHRRWPTGIGDLLMDRRRSLAAKGLRMGHAVVGHAVALCDDSLDETGVGVCVHSDQREGRPDPGAAQ
jgi:hypothetical protein